MKRLLLLALIFLLFAATVSAAVYKFEDFAYPTGTIYNYGSIGGGYTSLGTLQYTGYNHYSAFVSTNPNVVRGFYIISTNTPSSYWAATYTGGAGTTAGPLYSWYDSSGNFLGYHQPYGGPTTTYGLRSEYKVVGGGIHYYLNGVDQGNVLTVATNPSYFGVGNYYSCGYNCGGSYNYFTNIVIGGTDHHAVNGLPNNWTIIRDLINPASTGVYAWNPSTSAWVLKDSNYMYVEADTDSTDSTTSENLEITNVQYGTVVNTTVIDSTTSYHNVQYNVANLLNTPTSLGVALPDGEYSIAYSGSTQSSKFWVISNGAAIATDKTSYLLGDTAIVTTTMLPAYFDTATYTYTLKLIDIYGTELSSQTINTATQTSTVSFPTSQGAGVRYLEVVATKKSDSTTSIMGYAAVTVYEYLGFTGHVYDGNTSAALSGASYNFTQGSTIVTGTSGYDGNYSVSGAYTTGSVLMYNFTKSGYQARNYSFTPITGAYGSKTVDITLYPLVATGTGSTRQGVTYDNVYGSIIKGGTVTLTNASETHSVTANALTGYYIFDNSRGGPLTSGICYFTTETKTGYAFYLPTDCKVAS